jgi:hypothetical protein
MRARGIVSLALALALGTSVPAAGTEAEALRREMEQMRRQFEALQEEYQKALRALGERLQRVEARPQTAAAAPVLVQAPAGQAPPAGPPTLMDLARPRAPFSLGARTGAGQLLFDLGVAGDFIANFTSDEVERDTAGTFEGRENRFFPREIELAFFGQIDPYARGEVRLEAAEEFEDGERELHVGLAEAHLTLLTLPLDTQAKLGRMRARWGLLNESHQHALPQPDRPNVLQRFFGEEQLVEDGGELTWVAPLPFYLETLLGVFNGDNEDAFGRGSLREPLVTARVRTFLELGRAGALQLGASGAWGRGVQELELQDTGAGTVEEVEAEGRSHVYGIDLKYKYTPETWRHPLFTLGGEVLFTHRHAAVAEDPDGDGVETLGQRTRDRWGWYVYGEVQPWRRWVAGLRYDWTQFPLDPGREWAIEPYVGFMASDFLRFRLGVKHTERTAAAVETLGGPNSFTEVFLQGTFILGAHPAHPF